MSALDSLANDVVWVGVSRHSVKIIVRESPNAMQCPCSLKRPTRSPGGGAINDVARIAGLSVGLRSASLINPE